MKDVIERNDAAVSDTQRYTPPAQTTDPTLAEDFQTYFEVGLAATPAEKRKVFQLRYEVYCEEFQFEDASKTDEKLESDEYDEQALHCRITHRQSGKLAACVRLIRADDQDRIMPIERYAPHAFDDDFLEHLEANRDSMCEVSRLTVDSRFRRVGSKRPGRIDEDVLSKKEQKVARLLSLTATMAANAAANLIGRPHMLFMWEPFMPRLLKRFGVSARRVGQYVEYHGARAPHYLNAAIAPEMLPPDLKVLCDDVYESVKADCDAIANLHIEPGRK